MKMMIVAVAMMIALCVGAPLQSMAAGGVDMNEYTCNDLMKERVEDIGLILMWVDGYISCETQDLYLDREWIQELAEMIGEACQGKPNVYLIDVVEDIAAE